MVIYCITNIINKKVYIGQTSLGENRRWSNHKYYLRKGTHKNQHLQNAWNKYGEQSFIYSVLYTAQTKEELNQAEKDYIQKLQSYKPEIGYNLDLGGGVGRMTEENKEKLRQRMIGNKHTLGFSPSEETREKQLLS